MATGLTAGGIVYPIGGDEFDPAGDMQEQAESIDPRLIYPVANLTERAALAAALAPTASRPLYVHRADAPARAKLERTENGTAWTTHFSGTRSTYTPTVAGFGSGFVATGRYTLNGQVCTGSALVDVSAQGVTGEITIGLPFAADTTDPTRPGIATVGTAFGFTDLSVRWTGTAVLVGTQTVVINQSGTTNANSRWGVGVPANWTSSGFAHIEFSYEIA
jgi:hypothetical protein